MKPILIAAAATLLSAPFSPAALAQEPAAAAPSWDWKVAPYIWGTGIDGALSLGPISRPVDVTFADILDVISGGALVHIEASHGDHRLYTDAMYMSLEPDDEGGGAHERFSSSIVEAGYLYELSHVGLEAGLRYWNFELEIEPARLPAVEAGNSFTDAFVGFRLERPLGDAWKWTTDVSVGGGGSAFSYGVQFVFARKLTSGNAFVVGFKALGVDYSNESVNGTRIAFDAVFAGATIGYLFD